MLNATSGRVGLAPVNIQNKENYAQACILVEDALAQFPSDGTSNFYADLKEPLEFLTHALQERRGIPIIVHRRIIQTARRIERLTASDSTLAEDFRVRTLLEDLRVADAIITEEVPSVAEELAQRARQKMVGLSASDRDRLVEATDLLAEVAEEPVMELAKEGLDALQIHEEGAPINAEGNRERVYAMGWILSKLPTLRPAMKGISAAADVLSKFDKAIRAVEALLSVLQRLFPP